MKNLRRLSGALVFTIALTIPAFAGEMDTGIAPPPQAATTEGDIQTTVTGQMETDSSEATVSGSAADIALNLLQNVLSLF
jgi:hypothetical protein